MGTRFLHSTFLLFLYVGAAWFGITYSSLAPTNLSVLWLPPGIAIVGLITLGWNALPVIFVASLLVHVQSQSDSLIHLFSLASIDTLQPAIGAWIYGKCCSKGCLFDEKNFIRFLLGVVLIPPMITSWAIILTIQSSGNVTYESVRMLLYAIGNTTISDALGILIVVPLYDAFLGIRNRTAPRRDILEFILLTAFLMIVLAWLTSTTVIRPIVVLVPLTLLALRNGVIGSSVGFALTATVLIVGTVQGVGPFTVGQLHAEYLGLMTVLMSVGLPIHLVAISIRNVKTFTATLEQRVDERTAELREKESRLIDLNRDKDRLMAIIGHDLRNPIQGLIGLGELVASDAKDKQYDDIDSYGTMIQNSARQTLQLLQNLLDWSASQSGRIRFNPQPTDISRLISETLHVFSEQAKSKAITLHVDVELGLTASVDKHMMSTILRNLISNALKFSSAGGSILTSAQAADHGFRLVVQDTGVGMTNDRIDSLFGTTAVASTSGTDGEKGTGLGLLLVHEFATKHHAEIRVDSTPGQGTRFELLFPPPP